MLLHKVYTDTLYGDQVKDHCLVIATVRIQELYMIRPGFNCFVGRIIIECRSSWLVREFPCLYFDAHLYSLLPFYT